MIILFVDDENGHMSKDPSCHLVGVPEKITKKEMRKVELHQIGVMRKGGNWKEMLSDLGTTYTILKWGKYSELKDENHDLLYHVISGNY